MAGPCGDLSQVFIRLSIHFSELYIYGTEATAGNRDIGMAHLIESGDHGSHTTVAHENTALQ